MTSGLVSCILPVFNCERFVGAAIDSILGQTYRPIEVIAVDDGSTDGTPGVLERFAPTVRVLKQANAGHGAARNAGVRASAGEFIAFLDADDLWHRDKLARQIERFQGRPELGASFTRLVNFRGEAPPLDGKLEPPAADAAPGYTSVTMLVRRQLFDSIGFFDETLRHANDRDWLLRAAERRVQFELLADVLVYRRLHDANRSAALGAFSRAEYLRIVKASLDRRRARHGTVEGLRLGSDSSPEGP